MTTLIQYPDKDEQKQQQKREIDVLYTKPTTVRPGDRG